MKGIGPRKVRGKRGIDQTLLFGKYCQVGVSERSEAEELVATVDQQKKQEHRRRDLAIRQQPQPKFPSPHLFKPKHEQKKKTCRHGIEASGEPGKQIQSERSTAHK